MMHRLEWGYLPVKLDFCGWSCLLAYGQDHHAGAPTTRLPQLQGMALYDYPPPSYLPPVSIEPNEPGPGYTG